MLERGAAPLNNARDLVGLFSRPELRQYAWSYQPYIWQWRWQQQQPWDGLRDNVVVWCCTAAGKTLLAYTGLVHLASPTTASGVREKKRNRDVCRGGWSRWGHDDSYCWIHIGAICAVGGEEGEGHILCYSYLHCVQLGSPRALVTLDHSEGIMPRRFTAFSSWNKG